MIHLSQSQQLFLENNVVKPLSKKGGRIFLFGSRAVGNHHDFSDVDLLIKSGKEIPNIRTILAEIEEKLIESSFPYKVDLVLDSDLAESYRNNIEKQLIELKPNKE